AGSLANYSVNATSVDGCTNSTSFSLNIKPAPVVSAAAFTSSICKGSNVTLFALGDALTYTWSANANSSNAPVIVVTPNQSEVYSITGTAENNCSSTASWSITVNTAEPISATSSKPAG